MNNHNLDDISERIAEICFYNDEDIEQIKSLYLRITHDEKDLLDLEVFYKSFQIPTQELYDSIFNKYNKIRWNSFFQIVSILSFGRLDLLLPFTLLINGILYTELIVDEKQLERYMKCIGLESEIGPFLKHENLTLPTSYKILQSHLENYKIIRIHLFEQQSYIRDFIFPKKKAKEISNRYVNLESRYNYTITHRGKIPKRSCFSKLISCISSAEKSIYDLNDCGNFDYEINVSDVDKAINHIIIYFQMLFFPNISIPSNTYRLPNKSIQIIKKQGSTHTMALTPRSFSRLKMDGSKCSRVFESYRINGGNSLSFSGIITNLNINNNESKSQKKSAAVSLVSNDFGWNSTSRSLFPSNTIVPDEKVCELHMIKSVLSPKSPTSPLLFKSP